MSDIRWTTEMSVGVESIDTDHRLLLGLIAQLDDAVRGGQGPAIVSDILAALLDYTAYHFGREEALMGACGYPDAEAHAHTHHVLRTQVAQIQERYLTNPDTIHHREVQAFLSNWLIAHIMGRDKLYSPFMASKSGDVRQAERRYAEDLANRPRAETPDGTPAAAKARADSQLASGGIE